MKCIYSMNEGKMNINDIISELKENIYKLEWDLPHIVNPRVFKSKLDELKKSKVHLNLMLGLGKN